MDKQTAIRQMRLSGLISSQLSPSFTLPNFDRVIHHGMALNETDKTFLVKCAIGKIIHDKKEHYVSEFEFKQRKVDILHIKPNEYVRYEVATKVDREAKKEPDTALPGMEIVIDLNKVPNDINKMMKHLRGIVI